jgi:hypothetical protein
LTKGFVVALDLIGGVTPGNRREPGDRARFAGMLQPLQSPTLSISAEI